MKLNNILPSSDYLSVNLLSLLFLFVFSSCTYAGSKNLQPDFVPEVSPQSPVKVTLGSAYIVERTILLRIELEFLDDIDARSMVAGVIGLREGAVLEEQYTVLSEMLERDSVSRGERIQVPFSLGSGELTEFQVKVYWGDEGTNIISKKTTLHDISEIDSDDIFSIKSPEVSDTVRPGKQENPETDLRKPDLKAPDPVRPPMQMPSMQDSSEQAVVLSSVEVHENDIPCENDICPKMVRMRGSLENNSPFRATSLALAFGLFWVPEGKLPQVPEHQEPRKASEEALEFGEKILEPGEVIDFEVVIGRPIYKIQGGTFMPHVRILGFSLLE